MEGLFGIEWLSFYWKSILNGKNILVVEVSAEQLSSWIYLSVNEYYGLSLPCRLTL